MWEPTQELDKIIGEIRQAGHDAVTALRDVAPEIVGRGYQQEFQRAIDERRSPGGKAHKPLKPQSRYPTKKSRNPLNHVLRDSDGMRNSAKYDTPKPGEVEIFFDGKDERGREPQKYHQAGTRHMVARRVVELSDVANRSIKRALKSAALGRARSRLSRVVIDALTDEADFGK